MAHVNNHHRRRLLPRERAVRLVGAMSVITALVLSGCSGDDEESTSMATTAGAAVGGDPPGAVAPVMEATAATEAAREAATEATDAPADSADAAAFGPGVAVDVTAGRLLAVEVTAAVEVADVSTALPEVVAIAARREGQVYGSDVSLGDAENARGTVVIKLPPEQVEPAIADVAALGTLIGRFQDTEDVTDTVTDVETRIISQQQSVDRVQAMLAEAKDLGEVVMLEGELTSRQLVLEQLIAQQRNLRNRTALATLTVELSATPVATTSTTTTTTTVVPAEEESIGDAFRGGGEAFTTTMKAVLIFIGYTGPFLAIGLVALLIGRRILRRRSGHPATQPPVSPAPPTPERQREPVGSGN
jgi:hypothetical protein